MSVPQEFLIVKVPRPEVRAKKPGIAARAIVEYLIVATVYFDAIKECFCVFGYVVMNFG